MDFDPSCLLKMDVEKHVVYAYVVKKISLLYERFRRLKAHLTVARLGIFFHGPSLPGRSECMYLAGINILV